MKKGIVIFAVVFPLLIIITMIGSLSGASTPVDADRPTSIFGFQLPTDSNHINSPYGKRDGILDGFHHGTDLACSMKDPIYTVANGTVLNVGVDIYGANYVRIVHYMNGTKVISRYWHMDQVYVHDGQEVVQGQVIAACGMTGYATGPHLHFELYIDGKEVNPEPYLPLQN